MTEVPSQQILNSDGSLRDDEPDPPPKARPPGPQADPPGGEGPQAPLREGEGHGGAGRQEKREEEGRGAEGWGSNRRADPPPTPRASQSTPEEISCRLHPRSTGECKDPATPELKR